MYHINYVEGLIVKEKYGSIFIRVLKILNFIVHVLILLFLVLAFFTNMKMDAVNSKINVSKKTIEQKRSDNKISEIEKEWEQYYYQLLAVRELLEKNTNYGLIFKDLGTYLPQKDYVVTLYCSNDKMDIGMVLDGTKVEEMNSFYDYSKILNSAFGKSEYIKSDVLVDSVKEEDLEKRKVNVLDIKIPVLSRK